MREIVKMSEAAKRVEDAFNLHPEPVSDDELPVVDADSLDQIPNVDLANLSTAFREPWERYPDETDLAWNAFRTYRDLGLSRTYMMVARDHGYSISSINLWSKRFEWAMRAQAWDTAEDRVYQLARLEAVKAMAERHGTIIVEALEAMSIPFQALKLKLEVDPNTLEDLSERDTVKLLDTASKMARNMPGLMSAERLARGMPTEIVDIQGEITHTHEMKPSAIGEILAALKSTGAFELGTGDGTGDGTKPGPSESESGCEPKAGGLGELNRSSDSDDFEIVEAEVVEVHSGNTAP